MNILKILILEDLTEDAGLIEESLKRKEFNSHRSEWTRGMNLLTASAFRSDVILSDHALPQFNSTEALKFAGKPQKGPFHSGDGNSLRRIRRKLPQGGSG